MASSTARRQLAPLGAASQMRRSTRECTMNLARFGMLLLLVPVPALAEDYGPDTCKSGFVWREACQGDHVCVPPETRAQTSADNQGAGSRLARPLEAERQAPRVDR